MWRRVEKVAPGDGKLYCGTRRIVSTPSCLVLRMRPVRYAVRLVVSV